MRRHVDRDDAQAKNDLLDTYGGQEYIDAAPPRELIFAQTENYVEYSRSGKVIKGAEETVVRSKFPEVQVGLEHKSVLRFMLSNFKIWSILRPTDLNLH